MHIELGKLPVGRWRNLTPAEVEGLMPPPERRAAEEHPMPTAARSGSPR
jgi:hypothetical protein